MRSDRRVRPTHDPQRPKLKPFMCDAPYPIVYKTVQLVPAEIVHDCCARQRLLLGSHARVLLRMACPNLPDFMNEITSSPPHAVGTQCLIGFWVCCWLVLSHSLLNKSSQPTTSNLFDSHNV
jgi:hypothetical protein